MRGDRLPDRLSVAMLTWVYPPRLVDAVLLETDRLERRKRSLPARFMTYFVMGMGLFSDASYEEALRLVAEGLTWSGVQDGPGRRGDGADGSVPSKAAISHARDRLGVEPVRALFEAACSPMANERTHGAFHRGLRVVRIAGTCLDVVDTPANVAAFGRPGTHRGVDGDALPQVRLVGVFEAGTQAIVDAAIGPYAAVERTLAERLLPRLDPGSLCLADRDVYAFDRFRAASLTGAQLLWRVPMDVTLSPEQGLPDGSYLATLRPVWQGAGGTEGALVRVIEAPLELHEGDAAARGQGEHAVIVDRLVTTMLDPLAAPASELAALFRGGRGVETGFDELMTHPRGSGVVLRSKTREGVMQETYGLLLMHYAIRRLMHGVVPAADLGADRISL